MVPLAARAGLPLGVASHRSFVSLSTIARCEGSDKSARAATIFIHNGAPEALVGCHENGFSVDVGSCGHGLWFEGDVVAEALETSFEVGDGSGLGNLVEVGFSEFAVGFVSRRRASVMLYER